MAPEFGSRFYIGLLAKAAVAYATSAVGLRVKSVRGAQFRRWAETPLKEALAPEGAIFYCCSASAGDQLIRQSFDIAGGKLSGMQGTDARAIG